MASVGVGFHETIWSTFGGWTCAGGLARHLASRRMDLSTRNRSGNIDRRTKKLQLDGQMTVLLGRWCAPHLP